MHGRILFRLVLAVAIVALLGLLGGAVYNAGVGAGMAAAAPGTPAAPYPYWGYGWGSGFGFFGFFGFLLVLFLVFGLIRAFAWGGGRRRWDGDHGPYRGRWEGRGHDLFEEWHRRAHGGDAGSTIGADPTRGPDVA
jgi:hypothetical protein